VLVVGTTPVPEVGAGEVRVKIYVSGLNPSDDKKRTGYRGTMPFPRIIPHSDGAGIIDQVGEGVSHARLGQRVWIYNAQWKRAFGTAAEYITLPQDLAVPLPDRVSFIEGATLGVPALTAHRLLFADGPIKGQTILVAGGTGVVGSKAVSLGRWAGATVITTVGEEEKKQLALEHGAHHVINYKTEDVAARILTITNNKGVDRIIELNFGGNLEINTKVIRPYGVITVYANDGSPPVSFPPLGLMFSNVVVRLVMVYDITEEGKKQAHADITKWLEANQYIRHVINSKYSLDNIVDAHKIYGGKGVGGKGAAGHVLIEIRTE